MCLQQEDTQEYELVPALDKGAKRKPWPSAASAGGGARAAARAGGQEEKESRQLLGRRAAVEAPQPKAAALAPLAALLQACGAMAGPSGGEASEFMGQRGSTVDTRDFACGGPAGPLAGLVLGRRGSEAAARGKAGMLKEPERAAVAAVDDFCRRCPASRVEPQQEDLAALLAECAALPRAAVCKAFQQQLSWSTGDLDWQPKLRALHALEHFGQHEEGRAVARRTANNSVGILHYLVDAVPQCREKAAQVLDFADESQSERLRDPLPPR